MNSAYVAQLNKVESKVGCLGSDCFSLDAVCDPISSIKSMERYSLVRPLPRTRNIFMFVQYGILRSSQLPSDNRWHSRCFHSALLELLRHSSFKFHCTNLIFWQSNVLW